MADISRNTRAIYEGKRPVKVNAEMRNGRLIEIMPPLPGSKVRNRWAVLIGGVELTGDSEAEVRRKAIEYIHCDPVFGSWLKPRLILLERVYHLAATLRDPKVVRDDDDTGSLLRQLDEAIADVQRSQGN